MDYDGSHEAASSYAELDFTVHEYLNSASDVRTSRIGVLAEGYGMVKAAIGGEGGWSSTKFVLRSSGQRCKKANAHVFRADPPVVKFEEGWEKMKLKEWGSQVSVDEVFHLRDLEEFVGTDFSQRSKSAVGIPQKRANEEHPPAKPDLKRRKLNIASLYNILPLPHIHPSPFFLNDVPVKGRPFNKVEPIFLAPYTALHLSDDIRSAWLIPVRGFLRWDSCTSAELLDSTHVEPCPPVSSGSNNQISWTEDSLLQFWRFLLELRKVGSVGPLGVSFHASRNYQSTLHSSEAASTTLSTVSLRPVRSISMVDHIKVYHDASKALYVRYALDIWQYQLPSDNGRTKKFRMLKGARLVLVDDVSKGMMIS